MNNPARRRQTGRCLVAALALTARLVVHAEPAPPSADVAAATNTVPARLSLAEAQHLALARNWDLLAAKSDVDIAFAQRLIAREFPNPTLSLSSAFINVDNHPSGTVMGNGVWDRNYDTIAAISQLLEIGGKRASRKTSALEGWRVARARFADARRLLDQGVANAYIAALLATENARILRASAAALRQEAQIAATRFQAGEIAATDQKQIEIAADQLELEAQSAEAAATSARVNVEVLLGVRHPLGQWTAVDTFANLVTKPMPRDRLEPATPRPDLLAAESAKAKADADLKLQKAYRVPDPTVEFQYEHNPPDFPNTVGVGISLPLPLWNHNRGAIEAARSATEQARAQVEKVRGQIAADIINARIAYDDAAARLARYTQSIQPRSQAVTETIAFAYHKGGASLLDLLQAERNDNDVRLAAAQAASDTAIAAAALEAALAVEPSGESPR